MNRDPQPNGEQYSDGSFRYGQNDSQDRYRDFNGREVGLSPYSYQAVTLEGEARTGGYLPNNAPQTYVQASDSCLAPHPNAPANDVWTVSMRGEPGYDDDPMSVDGRIVHDTAPDGDISDID